MKITFKNFLNENAYKTNIDDNELVQMLKDNCSESLQYLLNTPIVRGMTSSESAMIIHGEEGGRKSANTSNHYTKILDHTLELDGYPKRSKSIICANWENKDYASSFGVEFAILPFDGVKIGVCSDFDMWQTIIPFKEHPVKIMNFNSVMLSTRALDKSFNEIVSSIEKTLTEDKDKDTRSKSFLRKWFYDIGVKQGLEKYFSAESLKFSLMTVEQISELRTEHELWIGGKCIAILFNKYKELKPLIKDS